MGMGGQGACVFVWVCVDGMEYLSNSWLPFVIGLVDRRGGEGSKGDERKGEVWNGEERKGKGEKRNEKENIDRKISTEKI